MLGAQIASPPLSEEELKKQQERVEAKIKLRNMAWEDLTVDQKMERMREIVKNNQNSMYHRFTELEDKARKMENHSHQNNEVVIPLKEKGFGIGALTGQSKMPGGKEWF